MLAKSFEYEYIFSAFGLPIHQLSIRYLFSGWVEGGKVTI